jgi:hypothetical protein
VRPNADVTPDEVVGPTGAGVGTGLDQAEEARLGVTDEELKRELGVEREPLAPEDETPVNERPRAGPTPSRARLVKASGKKAPR